MMANAYSRVLARPSVCMAASGPGTVNLLSGVAHAFVDGAPVVAIGGSSPVSQYGLGAIKGTGQSAIEAIIQARTEGGPFTSIVGRGDVYGVQFHPEKSSAAGLALLANFTSVCARVAA